MRRKDFGSMWRRALAIHGLLASCLFAACPFKDFAPPVTDAGIRRLIAIRDQYKAVSSPLATEVFGHALELFQGVISPTPRCEQPIFMTWFPGRDSQATPGGSPQPLITFPRQFA